MLPRLYVITDRASASEGSGGLVEATQASVAAGARMIQLRDKGSRPLRQWRLGQRLITALAGFGDCVLVVNDRADLAVALGADGVHRSADSLPVTALRRVVEVPKLVGVSCHGVEDVVAAAEQGADFVTLSPIFETSSKPGYGPPLGVDAIEEAATLVDVPIFALGGVEPDAVADCLAYGAHGVAVMSGIMAADDPYEATAAYLERLDVR